MAWGPFGSTAILLGLFDSVLLGSKAQESVSIIVQFSQSLPALALQPNGSLGFSIERFSIFRVFLYPEGPACNVCDSTQDPVTTTAGNPKSIRIRKRCNSTDISVQQTQPDTNRRRPDSPDQDVYGIEIEKCLEARGGERQEEINRSGL
jgi:hypothetical protein